VDGADFVVWQTHFPTSPGAAGSAESPSVGAGDSSGSAAPLSEGNSSAPAAATAVSQKHPGNSSANKQSQSARTEASSKFQHNTVARGNSRFVSSAATLTPQTRVAHHQAERPPMSTSVVAALFPSSTGSIGESDESQGESKKCAKRESALISPAKPRRDGSSVASIDRFYAAYPQSYLGSASYRQRALSGSTGDEMDQTLFEELSCLAPRISAIRDPVNNR
jgi:hypothetical protein